MRASATLAAYLVPARSLALPAPLEPITLLRHATGLLAYVEYLPPSPLVYHELIWMPALVRARSRAGRTARGYHVAVMYVDDERTLRGGREIWALPKTKARFELDGDRVAVHADDGTSLVLRRHAVGPGFPLRGAVATLQIDGGTLVRFRSDFSGTARAGRLHVERFESTAPAWSSFAEAYALPLPSASLESVDSTMQPPRRIEL
jgi:hypothetical protein